jgi:uncharacterized protein YbbC (DUF1343 family)
MGRSDPRRTGMSRRRTRIGVERWLDTASSSATGARTGLVLHPASVLPSLQRSDDALQDAGVRLVALFGPQHGARGDKQDNMIESAHYSDRRALPVHSLYGEVRKPTPAMLAGLDVLLFDLQDVGVRIYTYTWTMLLCMEACREAGVRFVVLDRPNPVGGVERAGPLLRAGYESFIGLRPLPLRHGLTLGEIARYGNATWQVGCDLDVVPCEGWHRAQYFDETGLPYVLPSPNLPTLDSCVVYPGMVLLEGTNLSEGRGTTRPFELFGAPYLDPDVLVQRLAEESLPGVHFRPCHIEPTFQKHAGQLCGGAQLHVTDRARFEPVRTAVAILRTAAELAPTAFAWRPPPYEYEYEKPAIDILWGSDQLRTGIQAGRTTDQLLEGAAQEIAAFSAAAAPYLLY